ncbi:MAG: carboxymuconolactone decarboxylase family protein [Planctomycetota bacterium]|jgi:uncharacterized peroxidase-related enzyme
MEITVHDPATATEGSRETLNQVESAFGFIPNLMKVFAGAPPLLQAYLAASELFGQTSLDPTERQIVLLATSFENRCTYCVAAHTVIARMQKVPSDVIEALREDRPLADAKLEALRRYAAETARTRGWPSEATKQRFLESGYTARQALEVILGVGFKTLANYANHLADTPLDDAFAPGAWEATAVAG